MKVTSKSCTTCGKTLRFGDFQRDRTHADGLKSQCKECRSNAQRIRRAKKRAAL